jgi:methylmalonyl-CoA mutase cobalamin-binding domain/chain
VQVELGTADPHELGVVERQQTRTVALHSGLTGDEHPVVGLGRFVTAASLFDGHDASINIMRRILQAGREVIHLGHNRSVDEVVTAALQEDVQGIAISLYQGGHVEYFKYMVDLLRERGGGHIKVFGGGGGVIVPAEIASCTTTASRASTRPRTASAWACRA